MIPVKLVAVKTTCGRCGGEYIIPVKGPAIHTCPDGTTLPIHQAAMMREAQRRAIRVSGNHPVG